MSDHSNERTNQSHINDRENLFYLLQTLAEHAEGRADERKTWVESSAMNEQIDMYVRQNGIM